MRPDPSATMLGPQGGGASSLTPEAVSAGPDANALQNREGGFDASGQLRGQVEAVYFDFDKSSVKQAERPKIQAAKAYLDKNAQYRMLLEGIATGAGRPNTTLLSAIAARTRSRSTF